MSAGTSQLNLDYLAAQCAQRINDAFDSDQAGLKKLDTLSTKALGILQEKGVYALFLFLLARKGKGEAAIAWALVKELLNILKERPLNDLKISFAEELCGELADGKEKKILGHVVNQIGSNPDILILVRDVYEQILVYSRYNAKARRSKE